MKTILRKAGVAAMVLLFTFSLACGGGDNSSEYPDAVKQNFLSSCTSTGGSQDECQCALDGIQAQYSLDEFVDLENQLTGDVPDELVKIIADCIGG